MEPIDPQEFVAAVQGRFSGPRPAGAIAGVETDSRRIRPHQAFFAIRGDRHDGHDFVEQAVAAGAAIAVISRPDLVDRARRCGWPILLTDDTVRALGRLGAWYRTTLSARVVAITGSNGKTTAKAMLEAALTRLGKTCSAPKSFNNHIGVPLTLLTAHREHDYIIVELGTNHTGEIAQLAALTGPDMAMITSISAAHAAGLGGLDQIAEEKTSLLKHLPEDGFAAVNTDEPAVSPYLENFAGTLVRFGTTADADLRADSIRCDGPTLRFTVNGQWSVRLNMLGRHNALNALGAWAVASRLGLGPEDICQALATVKLPAMRLEPLTFGSLTVINDAYNANPASVTAALQTLAELPVQAGARRVAVLADMLELGTQAAAMHQDAGRLLAEIDGIGCLICVGPLAQHIAEAVQTSRPDLEVHRFEDAAAASRGILDLLRPNDVVLLKGSRAMHLEQLLDPLAEAAGPSASAPAKAFERQS